VGLSGVPQNPPRALAHQMQQALNLRARPTIIMLVGLPFAILCNTLTVCFALSCLSLAGYHIISYHIISYHIIS